MKKVKKGDYIKIVGECQSYKDFNVYNGYYEVISSEHYGVFIKAYSYLIPHSDYTII